MKHIYYFFRFTGLIKGKLLSDNNHFCDSIRPIRNAAALIFLMSVLTPILYGQALFTETFDYADGGLANCSQLSSSSPYYPLVSSNVSDGIWVTTGPSSFPAPILVQTDALTYSGYSLSGLGKIAFFPRIIGQSQSAYRTFTSSSVVYYSAMIMIDTAYNLNSNNPSDPNYDFNGTVVMGHGSSSSNYRGLLVYNRVSNSDPLKKIVVGVSFLRDDPGTAFATAKPLDTLQTHLIVVRTERATGISKLWVNPDLSGSEPAPDAICTNSSAADGNNLDRLILYQRDSKPTNRIGGIRVATTWNDAVLPVELTSFIVTTSFEGALLKWTTATEVNNYGFEVERMSNVKGQMSDGWEKIGFVNGNGNSNSPKSYSFVDDKVNSGKLTYRLKQIDNDGQFEYSKTIEVDLGTPTKFALSQNYPNPFNPSTTIRFNLPEASIVKLSLYNILGQEISAIVNEYKESGVHTINVDARNLISGMYIYKIEAGSFRQTRKMTLLK